MFYGINLIVKIIIIASHISALLFAMTFHIFRSYSFPFLSLKIIAIRYELSTRTRVLVDMGGRGRRPQEQTVDEKKKGRGITNT